MQKQRVDVWKWVDSVEVIRGGHLPVRRAVLLIVWHAARGTMSMLSMPKALGQSIVSTACSGHVHSETLHVCPAPAEWGRCEILQR